MRGKWAALWGTSHWNRSSDQAEKVQLQQREGNQEESAMETQAYGIARQFSPRAWLKGKDVCSSEAVIPAMYLSSLISSFFSAKERILLVLALKGVCVHAKLLQPCPTLHDPMHHSPSEFLCPWNSQARILEWVTISFSWHMTEPGLNQPWWLIDSWTIINTSYLKLQILEVALS